MSVMSLRALVISVLLPLVCAGCEPSGGTRMPGEGGGGSSGGSNAEADLSPWVGKDLLVLTNLHPDTANRQLYSLNYQQSGLIPICTKIHVIELDESHMRFAAGDIEYEYAFRDEYMTEGQWEHLGRYFGEPCDDGKSLGELDHAGIAAGRASVGMTKDGVIKAIGYPPPHATPDLKSPAWRYWKNRWDTFIVHFDGEKVSSIEN